MQKAILGKKLGMTQVFAEDGTVIPVTVVLAGPVTVTQLKTVENDGYKAVQVGFTDIPERKVNKPLKGHFDKAGVSYKKTLREFRFDGGVEYNVGDEIKADVFAAGDKIDVTGTSKGKGFAGTTKRWGTHRGPMSHGSGYHRGVGSMGACSTPSRVMKNKKLPDIWVLKRLQFRTLTLLRQTLKTTFFSLKEQFRP